MYGQGKSLPCTPGRHQRIVAADVSDLSILQKDDAIRLANGGQPVGDNDHQTALGGL